MASDAEGHFFSEQDTNDEFSADDDGAWDGVDIIDNNDQMIDITYTHQDKQSEECWKCSICSTINNVKLTIRKYNYKCCGCKESLYIPNQTETTYQSSWHSPNDYLQRMNKIWICHTCKSSNSCMKSTKCLICQSPRYDMELCQYCNTNIQLSLFIQHHSICNQIKQNKSLWICVKCHAKHIIDSATCNICNCPRSMVHDYSINALKRQYIDVVVYGFCRTYYDENVPNDVKSIIMALFQVPTFSEDQDVSKSKNKSNKKMIVHYNKGYEVKLYGDEYVQYPNMRVWKFILNVDPQFVVKLNGDNEAAKVHEIAIGVTYEKKEIDETYGTERFITTYATLSGHGGQSVPIFRDGDIIIVELDCCSGTLSFGINENWFGAIYRTLPIYTKYQLYIKVKQQGVIITSIC